MNKIDTAIRLYTNTGIPVTEIIKRSGTNVRKLYAELKKRGIAKRGTGLSGGEVANQEEVALNLYYNDVTMDSIAVSINRSVSATRSFIKRARERRGLEPRKTINNIDDLQSDSELIIELSEDLTVLQLANKFDCSVKTMQKFLKQHGRLRQYYSEELPTMNLDHLKKGGWLEIEGKTIITVGRVGRFYLIPITEEERYE